MIATNVIKINGKWYKAGEIIPEEIPEEIPGQSLSEFHYTKTDINRMSVQDLRSLATDHGVSNADSMTGGELKEYFISKFNL